MIQKINVNLTCEWFGKLTNHASWQQLRICLPCCFSNGKPRDSLELAVVADNVPAGAQNRANLLIRSIHKVAFVRVVTLISTKTWMIVHNEVPNRVGSSEEVLTCYIQSYACFGPRESRDGPRNKLANASFERVDQVKHIGALHYVGSE